MERVERLVRTWIASEQEQEIADTVSGARALLPPLPHSPHGMYRDRSRECYLAPCGKSFGRVSRFRGG